VTTKRRFAFTMDRFWHETDQSVRSDDVRLSGWTGSGRPVVNTTRLTHNGRRMFGHTFGLDRSESYRELPLELLWSTV
jgi:hypothetical protein